MFSEISKDLKNGTIEDTCMKHNITFKELVERSLRNNLPVNRDKGSDKFIYPRGKQFAIMKSIKGDFRYYGVYNTMEDARKVRNKLIDCNWDKSQLPSIHKELGVKTYGNGE